MVWLPDDLLHDLPGNDLAAAHVMAPPPATKFLCAKTVSDELVRRSLA